jgi:hypothetical protein
MRRLIVIALVVGAAIYLYRRSKLPEERRDLTLRRAMNERLTPILLRHGAADGSHTGLGVVEHLGRKSGTVRRTLIHPIVLGDRVAIPAPYAEGGQWPRNVLAAGCCRLQFRDSIYSLSNPRVIEGALIEDLPASEKLIGRVTGGRFLLMDVDSVVSGRFGDEGAAERVQVGEQAAL